MGFVDELKKYRLQFIRSKQNENLSVHTIRHYETGFRYFFEYVDLLNKKKRGKLLSSHVDENFIYDFLDWAAQKNGKQSQSTKKAYLVRISVFLRYVSKKSGAKFDFRMALEDVRIKIPKRERKSLTPEKRKRLYEYFEYFEDSKDPKDAQKALIGKLLFFTGIRAIELRGLELGDFELSENIYEFKVIGKGDKERRLYIGADLIKKEIALLTSHGQAFVCATKTGKPMCHSQLWKLTKKIFEEAMIEETGVHIFRHTFARTLVEKGVNLITLMELLGHVDIKTTQIYAKSNEMAKRDAVYKAFL